MYRNIFQKLILLQDTEPENVVIHTWSWTPKKYEQFMVSPSTGANRSPKQGYMATSVRKMRHINDLHGEHSCHIIRQRKDGLDHVRIEAKRTTPKFNVCAVHFWAVAAPLLFLREPLHHHTPLKVVVHVEHICDRSPQHGQITPREFANRRFGREETTGPVPGVAALVPLPWTAGFWSPLQTHPALANAWSLEYSWENEHVKSSSCFDSVLHVLIIP